MIELSRHVIDDLKISTRQSYDQAAGVEVPLSEDDDKYRRKVLFELVKSAFNGKESLQHITLIGVGSESVVIKGMRDDTVLAVDYHEHSPAAFESSITYNTHRLLSTLFPHNFPRFKKVGSSIGRFSEREFVESSDQKIKHSFQAVVNTLRELKIPILFDKNKVNFETGIDGGEYYLDKADFDCSAWNQVNIKQIEVHLSALHLKRVSVETVVKCLSRLRVLAVLQEVIIETQNLPASEVQIDQNVELISQDIVNRVLKKTEGILLSQPETNSVYRELKIFIKSFMENDHAKKIILEKICSLITST